MLNTDLNEKIYTIPMPIDKTYKVVISKVDKLTKERIIIMGISENEYMAIKHDNDICVKKDNILFHISPVDVLCFGDIDFHEGSEDCKILDTFNILDHIGIKGVCIPSKYNYDKHECYCPIHSYLYTETFKLSKLCRYLHGCLGKPKYTIIFRETKWA